MATYQSTLISSSYPARQVDACDTLFAKVSISAAAANSDVIQFFKVPANCTVVGAILRCTDIDTNGSPTVAIDVGDAGDTDRLFAASTIGRAGGSDTTLATTGLGYEYTSDTVIYATLSGVATGATGTISLTLFIQNGILP